MTGSADRADADTDPKIRKMANGSRTTGLHHILLGQRAEFRLCVAGEPAVERIHGLLIAWRSSRHGPCAKGPTHSNLLICQTGYNARLGIVIFWPFAGTWSGTQFVPDL